jgi:c(7)-type cytochrome triheme protein
LSDVETKAAVDYMLASVRDADKGVKPEARKKDESPKQDSRKDKPAQDVASKTQTVADDKPPVAATQTLPSAAALPVVEPAAARPLAPTAAPAEVNAFNRLLKPPALRNPAPVDDGIHDPANDGTIALQPPQEAFEHLPKSNAGNRINWVEALKLKKISPRYDRVNPNAEPIVMDLNIVREVKGAMPDVVYPHKQHTEWLDCSNCHPAIFIPQKGATSISMAAILLGEKCGVCHGKVAFPVSECRSCHSKKKDVVARPVASTPGK